MSIRDTHTAGGLQICAGLPLGGGSPDPPGFHGSVTGDVSALPGDAAHTGVPDVPWGFRGKFHHVTSQRKLQPAGFMNTPPFPLFFFHSYFLLLFLLYWSDQMF